MASTHTEGAGFRRCFATGMLHALNPKATIDCLYT